MVHFLLITWFNIPKSVELIILPKLLAVPKEPNFASVSCKSLLISFVADESKPLETFITPSILTIIANKNHL